MVTKVSLSGAGFAVLDCTLASQLYRRAPSHAKTTLASRKERDKQIRKCFQKLASLVLPSLPANGRSAPTVKTNVSVREPLSRRINIFSRSKH